MNNSKNDPIPIILSIAGLLIAASILIGIIKLSGQLAAFWVILVFQIVLVVLGVFVAALIASYLIGESYKTIMSKIDLVRREQNELFKSMNKRVTSYITTTVLIADAILIITDKSFKGEILPTILVSLFLLIFFWIANELMITEEKPKKRLGVLIWIIGLILLPTLAYVFDPDNFIESLKAISLSNKIVIAFTLIGFIFIPIAVNKLKIGKS